MREKESFFGDFLPISKKLPAGRRTAEAFDLRTSNKQRSATLTPTLSRQRERGKITSWIPA
jgi:hypothetical protein